MRLLATKIFTFDSAHKLPGYDGKCERLHGHTYRLEVTVERRKEDSSYIVEHGGPKDGMVVDFSILKDIVNSAIIYKVDHQPLHEVFEFRTTAENLILWMRETLIVALCTHSFGLEKLRLYETPESYVEVLND